MINNQNENLITDKSSIKSIKSSTGSEKSSSKPKMPELNPNLLFELEKEATQVGHEFYKLNKQLQVSLNHISAASVCCLQTFNDSTDKFCDSVDNITKEEELLLLKAKELSKEMEPVHNLHKKIVSIKTMLNSLESQI